MSFSFYKNISTPLVAALLAAYACLPLGALAQANKSTVTKKLEAAPPAATKPEANKTIPPLKPVTPAPTNLKPGLAALAWHYGVTQIATLPKPPADVLPNVATTVPGVIQADYKKNFNWPGQAAGIYVQMQGYMLVPAARTYAFKLRSFGASDFQINGVTVINCPATPNSSEGEAEVYLEAGYYPITVHYLKNYPTTYREVTLWVMGDGQKWDYVPESWYFHTPGQQKTATGYKMLTPDAETYRPGHNGAPLDELHPSFTRKVLWNHTWKPKVGGMDFLPDGRLLVSTWDSLGQVFVIENPGSADSNNVKIKRIAWGLAEPLGLKVVNGQIYVLQKHELTRLVDTDNDGLIDDYQTVCNKWNATGNFHEFAFGLEYKDGYFYAATAIAINPGGRSTIPQNKDRGRAMKIGLDGSMEFIAHGLRTPNTVGTGVDGELFIADNQGDWLPACKLVHVKKGAFYNNYAVSLYDMGKLEVTRPVVWFPQNEIGNSTSQPTTLNLGPYQNQMIAGDVHYGGLQRIYVEKVGGEYQGAVFKFSQGLTGGTNRLRWGPDGSLYIGQIGNPGNWGQYGKEMFGLDKLTYNGKVTFEPLAVKARKNGFEVVFTKALANPKAVLPKHFKLEMWRYEPTMQYGGPKIDEEELTVASVNPSADGKSLFLEIDGLEENRVVYLSMDPEAIKSTEGEMLWTSEAYYTLNNLPAVEGKVQAPKPTTAAAATKPAVPAKAAAPTKPAAAKPAAPAKPAEDDATMIALGAKVYATKGCRACHSLGDDKVLGPGFRDVAAYYRGKPNAEAHLRNKIAKGGSGVWGEQAMPPQYEVKKEDVARVVKYILSLK